MAAIGDGWEDGAWIEAGWITGAWQVGAAAVVSAVQAAHKLLAQRVVRSRGGSLQRRR